MASFILRPNSRFSTNLNQAVGDTTTTLWNVNAVPARVPCVLIIDPGTGTQEKVKCIATGSGTITVTRNFDTKGAFSHGFNATIVDYDSPEYITTIADLLEQNFNADYTPQATIFARQDFAAAFANFIVSGLVIPTSVSLTTTCPLGVAYYGGIRYGIAADGGHTYTASQDTYVDVNPATGAFTYNNVANNAAAPALTASSLRIAKLVSSGSAITSVTQSGFDSNGVPIYPNNGINKVFAALANIPTFPNTTDIGKRIQMGTGTWTTNGTIQEYNTTITFPVAFVNVPNVCVNIVATALTPASQFLGVSAISRSTTSFIAYMRPNIAPGNPETITFNWIAIG